MTRDGQEDWQKRRYKKRYVTHFINTRNVFVNLKKRGTLEMGVSGDIILCRYYIQKK